MANRAVRSGKTIKVDTKIIHVSRTPGAGHRFELLLSRHTPAIDAALNRLGDHP